jgi:hypothetical protein
MYKNNFRMSGLLLIRFIPSNKPKDILFNMFI